MVMFMCGIQNAQQRPRGCMSFVCSTRNSETTFNKLDIYFVSLEKAIEQPRRQICLLFAEEHYFCALGLPYYL